MSFFHFLSAPHERLRALVEFSHGSECTLVRLSQKGATESKIFMHVELKVLNNSSAQRARLLSSELNVSPKITELLYMAENRDAVQGLIVCERRIEVQVLALKSPEINKWSYFTVTFERKSAMSRIKLFNFDNQPFKKDSCSSNACSLKLEEVTKGIRRHWKLDLKTQARLPPLTVLRGELKSKQPLNPFQVCVSAEPVPAVKD